MHGFGLLRRGALLSALACLAAVGLAIPSTAAANVTSLTSCQPIGSPGKYRLDANVTTALADCFTITASDVTLILNGHTITGNSPLNDFGILVFGSGAKIVGPGTISGFVIAGIGIGGGSNGSSVRGVTATRNAEGILLSSGSNGSSVRGNVTTDNGHGIVADSGATGNTIIGNYAHGNSDDLFDNNSGCDSNVWKGNDFGTANQPCIG